MRCIPENHHAIAYEFVDRSPFGKELHGQRGKIARCLTRETIGIGGFRDAGEVTDIGEQDGDLPPDATKHGRDRPVDHAFD